MKKLLVLPVILILTASLALAASVSRNMPARVDPGSEVSVTLTLSGALAGESVAIEDTIPDAITVKSWEISGSEEAKADVSYVEKASQKEGFSRKSWAFTAASTSPSVTYKFDAPATVGSYEFDVRWVTSEGFSHAATTLAVRTVTCGDGICEGDENSDNCEADCPKAAPPTPVEEPEPVEALGKAPTAWIIAVIVIVLGIILIVAYQKKKQQV